jgi:hypothetical protein
MAVGYAFSSSEETNDSFVVTWNGKKWSKVSSPNQEGRHKLEQFP